MTVSGHDARYRQTRGPAFALVGLCVFLTLIVPMSAGHLDRSPILDFPLDFYLVAQGAPVILVVLLAWFARRQNAIDDRHEDYGREPWL